MDNCIYIAGIGIYPIDPVLPRLPRHLLLVFVSSRSMRLTSNFLHPNNKKFPSNNETLAGDCFHFHLHFHKYNSDSNSAPSINHWRYSCRLAKEALGLTTSIQKFLSSSSLTKTYLSSIPKTYQSNCNCTQFWEGSL